MILIAPYAQRLRNGNENPKNYPYWPELIRLLEAQGETIIQVGVTGEKQLVDTFLVNKPINALRLLLVDCRTWIAVDSFFQHLAWDQGKSGTVLWGQSDPVIFGHSENVNKFRSKNYFRPNQFLTWEQCEYKQDAFLYPSEIIDGLIHEFPR